MAMPKADVKIRSSIENGTSVNILFKSNTLEKLDNVPLCKNQKILVVKEKYGTD